MRDWKFYAGLNVAADLGLVAALWLTRNMSEEIPNAVVLHVSSAFSFGKLFSFF